MELNAKKIHLMECAEKLFAEKGYAETSIRDIAKQASMNSAMISYYFGSKENLVKTIFDYRTTDLGKAFSPVTSNTENSLQQVISFLNVYIDKVFEQKHFYKLVFQLQSSDKQSNFIEYFNVMRRRNYEILSTIFKHSAREGDKESEPDVAMIISTLVGTITHIVFNQSYYREVNNLKKMPENKFISLLKERTKKHLTLMISCLLK
jgi:AcrR family transcriptional regulator